MKNLIAKHKGKILAVLSVLTILAGLTATDLDNKILASLTAEIEASE